ncbi:MAG: prolipoprotein diacylglyceryl transferase [Phycisphaeraceae bacterium]
MPTLSAWLHNIDPFAIQFTETFGLRWYGLAYLTAFAVGWFLCQRIRKVGFTTLHAKEITDFVIIGAIAVVAGGRLGYVFFYKPHLLGFTSDPPYWGVLALQGGGMSSHGAMIGTALVIWWYARRERKITVTRPAAFDDQHKLLDHIECHRCKYDLHRQKVESTCPECGLPVTASTAGEVAITITRKHNFLHLLDFAAVAAAVGFLFGRIANFINGELVGRVCDEGYRWAVKFPQDMYDWLGPKWNTEALLSLKDVVSQAGVTAEQWIAAVKDHDARLVEVTLGKLIGTVQAGGTGGSIVGQTIAPLLSPHYPSQLFAAFLEGFCVLVVLVLVWLRPRKPGVIAGLFGVTYGIARIIDEFWRAPDAHIANQEFAAIGLTRGQLLSFIMVLFGIGIMWFAARKSTAKMGGLLPVKSAT